VLIHQMPDALSWACGTTDFDTVNDGYMRLLGQAWERRADARLAGLRARTGETSFARFLGAPETSRRLLWPTAEAAAEAAHFFEASLRAELAFAGHPAEFQEETWTALGDAAFLPDGQRFVWPQQPGMMPLDFGSPRARMIDLTGAEFETTVPRDPYTFGDLEAAIRKVREALQGVLEACPEAGRFIARFNKVLVIQPDPAAPRRSSSGSNGQFVGRSFVTNVQSPDITTEAVADAVVHEGIHGLLYMQQVMQPWGPSELIYNQAPTTASPWTGRMLPLRSFLEACFVWYGLLHFWCHALSNTVFEPREVRYHLARALNGFLRQRLPDLVADQRDKLLPDLIESVSGLQTNVQAAFGT
jgi:hypothetical protein